MDYSLLAIVCWLSYIIPCWLSYTPSLIIHSVSRLNKFRLVLLFHLLYKQYDAVG